MTTQTSRLISLDAFRGIIIAGMILVTDPSTYSAVHSQLLHAEWNGATLTDMIFPSFLFMVGFSLALSFTSRLNCGESKRKIASHIFYRFAILFAIGLAINGFPNYYWHSLRIPGILQRIAVCYLCCGLFYLYTNDFKTAKIKANLSKLSVVAVVLLIAYWLILTFANVPGLGAGHLDSYRNFPAYIDRYFIDINHMWAYGTTPGMGVTYDPEGILSTIPAIASTFIGVLTGQWWLQTQQQGEKKALWLDVFGIVLIIVGLLFSHYLPVNKRLWTPPFVLFSSGVAMLLFSFLYAVIDINGRRKWASPFLVLGSNAILAFVVSSIITTLLDRVHLHYAGNVFTLHQFGNKVCLHIGLPPINASLLYALVIVLINILILVPLYRKKVFVRI